MVRIRLKRTGTRNRSCFRVVVMDQRSTRDGRSIEEIGFYDPLHNEERIKMDRYEYWLGRGAQSSKTVADIARRIKDGTAHTSGQTKKSESSEESQAPSEKPAEDAVVEEVAIVEESTGETVSEESVNPTVEEETEEVQEEEQVEKATEQPKDSETTEVEKDSE